ncbi:hypothetical protein [Peromfec virus RodF7_5]|uniref:DUF5675 domain-containing protein n=1 Tax=Peromfec virus RodF7_5 TaxID=2929354 RepID=A0A976R8V1_9VIRU|nr:hypothetical protein [Peromfec virus RodF7_5]
MVWIKLVRNTCPEVLDPSKPVIGFLSFRGVDADPLFTLEPAVKEKYGRIPKGHYYVDWCMSPRFGRRMLRLRSVPHRSGILFHAGNTEADTRGCILVGCSADKNNAVLYRSKDALEYLIDVLGVRTRKDCRNVAIIEIIEDELPF